MAESEKIHLILMGNWVTQTFNRKKKLTGPGNQVTGPVPVPSFEDTAPDPVATRSRISKSNSTGFEYGPGGSEPDPELDTPFLCSALDLRMFMLWIPKPK